MQRAVSGGVLQAGTALEGDGGRSGGTGAVFLILRFKKKVCVWYVHMSAGAHTGWRSGASDPPVAGVAGSGELFTWVLRTEFWSFARAVYAFNQPVVPPAPAVILTEITEW